MSRSATDDQLGLPLGERFVRALAGQDASTLVSLFDDPLHFVGLTPGDTWTATSPTTLVNEILLGAWFEPSDVVTEILRLDLDDVGDRAGVRYRFRVKSSGHDVEVEQQAYFDVRDGRISWMHVVCSGFRDVTA